MTSLTATENLNNNPTVNKHQGGGGILTTTTAVVAANKDVVTTPKTQNQLANGHNSSSSEGLTNSIDNQPKSKEIIKVPNDIRVSPQVRIILRFSFIVTHYMFSFVSSIHS